MRKLVKDANGTVMELVSPNGFIPDGFTLVSESETQQEELKLTIRNKVDQVRAKRNSMLNNNDKEWMIASKKGLSLSKIEKDAQLLRDITETLEEELSKFESKEDIMNYDPFKDLGLSREY